MVLSCRLLTTTIVALCVSIASSRVSSGFTTALKHNEVQLRDVINHDEKVKMMYALKRRTNEEGHEEEGHEEEGHEHEEEGHEHEGEEGHEHEGEEGHDDNEGKPWGLVILASLIVNIVTLSGVIFLIPAFRRALDSKEGNKSADILIPAFAAGAIIATVLFLTLPEGLSKIQTHFMEESEEDHEEGEHEEGEHEEGEHEEGEHHEGEGNHTETNTTLRYLRFMEEEGHDEHSDHGFEFTPSVTWRFATSLLAGFILPILLAVFFPRPKVPSSADEDDEQHFKDNEEKG